MKPDHLWHRAKDVHIQISTGFSGNFDVCFDSRIPENTKNELLRFMTWVENNFSLPVTLWVDFEFKHYLLDRDKKRVGYLFYWRDFTSYPIFDNPNALPSIRLPVRAERFTLEEILFSFIEAISLYFAWLLNELDVYDAPSDNEVEEVLQTYLDSMTGE